LKKILSFAHKEKSLFVGFTIMVLVFCMGVKVTIVVLIFADTMALKSHQKINTGLRSNANKHLVG
jgi:hypothetical protein